MARVNWKKQVTVTCPDCKLRVAARVPRGGDGTAWRPYQHKDTDGKDCQGRYATVFWEDEVGLPR